MCAQLRTTDNRKIAHLVQSGREGGDDVRI